MSLETILSAYTHTHTHTYACMYALMHTHTHTQAPAHTSIYKAKYTQLKMGSKRPGYLEWIKSHGTENTAITIMDSSDRAKIFLQNKKLMH